MTKKVNHKHASYGVQLKYTITITNAGPGTAATPTITDRFSSVVSIVSIHPSTGSCKRGKPIPCKLATHSHLLPGVTNPNRFPLHNVKVCDRLPAGTMFVLASGRPTRRGRFVCWRIKTLRPHASKSFTAANAFGERMTARADAALFVCGAARDLPPLIAFTHPLSPFTNPLATVAC